MASEGIDGDTQNGTSVINDNNSSDYEIVHNSSTLIDKTLLIKAIFNESSSPYQLITAPQGYGKSTNLDMVKRFVERNINKKNGKIGFERDSRNYKLFKKDRLISHEKHLITQYFAKFATIKIELKSIYRSNIELLMKEYSNVLSNTFLDHTYLLMSNKLTSEDKQTLSKYLCKETCEKLSKEKLKLGITFLAKMLSKHCENSKIFVFVDDYDFSLLELITDLNADNELEKQFLSFYQNIFDNILNTKNIHRALIMGKSSLAAMYFPSNCPIEINNFLMDHQFTDYFGLTINEVDALIQKNNIVESVKSIFIQYFGFVTLQTKTIMSTKAILYCISGNLLSYYNHFIPFTENNMKAVLTNKMLAYTIMKICGDDWYQYYYIPYSLDTVRMLRIACTNNLDVNTINFYYFIRFMIELGWCRIRKSFVDEKVIEIKIANIIMKKKFDNMIESFYTPNIYKQLITTANHINKFSINSDNEYLCVLGVLLEEYIKTIYRSNISTDIINVNILLIIGKSQLNIIHGYNSFVIHGFYIENKLTAIICVIRYKSEVKLILKETVESNLDIYASFKHKNKIFMAINFDETLSVSFGVLTNSIDLNHASYYNKNFS